MKRNQQYFDFFVCYYIILLLKKGIYMIDMNGKIILMGHWQRVVKKTLIAPIYILFPIIIAGVMFRESLTVTAMITIFPLVFISSLAAQFVANIKNIKGLLVTVLISIFMLSILSTIMTPVILDIVSPEYDNLTRTRTVEGDIIREEITSPLNISICVGGLILSYLITGFFAFKSEQERIFKEKETDAILMGMTNMQGDLLTNKEPHKQLLEWYYKTCLLIQDAWEKSDVSILKEYTTPEMYEYLEWAIPWHSDYVNQTKNSLGFFGTFVNYIPIPEIGAEVEITELDSLNRRATCKLSFKRKRGKSSTFYNITMVVSLKNKIPLIESYVGGQNTIINHIMEAKDGYQRLQDYYASGGKNFPGLL